MILAGVFYYGLRLAYNPDRLGSEMWTGSQCKHSIPSAKMSNGAVFRPKKRGSLSKRAPLE
jgi:hypothetical protein